MSSGAGKRESRRGEPPLPMPDWDNPLPYDGYPESHDTEMIGRLGHTIRELQAWATAAYVSKPPRSRALALAEDLAETVQQLVAYAETLPPDQP